MLGPRPCRLHTVALGAAIIAGAATTLFMAVPTHANATTDGLPEPWAVFADQCDKITVALSNTGTAPAAFLTAAANFSRLDIVAPGEGHSFAVSKDVGSIQVTSGNEPWIHQWVGPGDCGTPTPTVVPTCDRPEFASCNASEPLERHNRCATSTSLPAAGENVGLTMAIWGGPIGVASVLIGAMFYLRWRSTRERNNQPPDTSGA